jgi:hypothetical protein
LASLQKGWTVEGGGVWFVKVDNVIIWIGENALLVGVVVTIFVAWTYWDCRKHMKAEEKIKRDKGDWRVEDTSSNGYDFNNPPIDLD